MMRILVALILCFFLFVPQSIADHPKRIVSGMPSITEILYALGLEDKIVGVTTNCNFPPQTGSKEKIGGFFLNLEKVVSLDPDMVVMLEGAQPREVRRFRDFGLPVYTMDPKTVGQVMEEIIKLGEMTGKRKRALEVVDAMRKKLELVECNVALAEPGDELVRVEEESADGKTVEITQYHVLKVKQPQALVIIGMNPLVVVGGETLIDDMLHYTGAQNIAYKTNAAYPQYSFENLMEEDPDFIIIPDGLLRKEEIRKDRRWQSLSAVKNNRVLFVDADKLSRPGPRVAEVIEEIAGFIYQ
ncbi:MAG: helical backbone metal receptor [Candidatus Margulisiibacteriota bacterium]|nr:helical backbone metal receptor [Candidatus Margulisiibacteriota bacterium]